MASTYSLVLIALCSLIYFNDGVKANCGGLIEGSYGTITSPGYPENYPPMQDCLWEIRGTPNKSNWFHFKEFQFEAPDSCEFDFVTIKSRLKNGIIREHGKFCDSRVENLNNITDSNILYIQFRSDSSNQYRGFEMEFYSVPFECDRLLEESDKFITSPRYPLPYPPYLNCTWTYQAPLNHIFKLIFLTFDIEEFNGCFEDYVTLQSRMANGEIRQHGKFCDTKDRFMFFSESNILQMQFVSHSNKGHKGFNATFSSISLECGGSLEGKGTITSPHFPDPYPPHLNCTWNIRAPLNHHIRLNFTHFETEESNECEEDYMVVQSKLEDGEIRKHEKFCGRKVNLFILSESNNLKIQFVSRSDKERDGFRATYVSEECGGLIEGGNGSIRSLFFPLGYPSNKMCEWTILAPFQRIIKLNFLEFEIEESSECVQEYVTVQSKMLDQDIREHGKFCGIKTPPVIVSDSNILLINFLSHNNKGRKGFNATFISDECGGLIEGGSGNINSPFFPDLYPPNKICEWKFLLPPQHKIKLNILHFEVEGGNGCPNDFLQIQSDSTNENIPESGKYCGHFGPPPITSKDSIILKFVSDRSIQRKGFKMEYIIDKWTDYESSVSSEKSTSPVYEATTTDIPEATTTDIPEATTTHIHEATTTHIHEATITPVQEATTAHARETTTSPIENQYDDITKDFVKSKTEEDNYSALQLLTKKVADLEERQKMIINNYENMFNKISRLLSSKNVSLAEKKFHFN